MILISRVRDRNYIKRKKKCLKKEKTEKAKKEKRKRERGDDF